MLDALKFAFEILIVGALAMPWIAVLSRMFPGRESSEFKFDLGFVPIGARSGVEIAVVLAFGYLVGSAASRFSRDFFNDEMWQPLPTEDVIRDNVYFDEYCTLQFFPYKYWSEPAHLKPVPDFCPKEDVQGQQKPTSASQPGSSPAADRYKSFNELPEDKYKGFNELVQEVFRLQDSVLLLKGVDRIDRLKQYFDQINILRGAAFNAFILFSLALFGGLGQLKLRWAKYRALKPLFFLPALAAIICALRSLWKHWFVNANSHYSDPPLAELVILLLAVIGLLVAWKPEGSKPGKEMPYVRICCIAFLLMVVSFGGWWWTEVMYDLQVIHSLAEISETGEAKPAADHTTGEGRELPSTTKPAAQTQTPTAAEEIKPH
jgi:hypothetical protein